MLASKSVTQKSGNGPSFFLSTILDLSHSSGITQGDLDRVQKLHSIFLLDAVIFDEGGNNNLNF